MINVGILGFQGSVSEHKNMLEKVEQVNTVIVKYKEDIEKIDGLILPGGESTTIGKLLVEFNLKNIIIDKIKKGMPVWGTCAGMILLSKEIINDNVTHLGVMDITIRRNGYGSQLNSFITESSVEEVSTRDIPLVFIRAPYIEEVGKNVKILKEYKNKIVAVKEDNMLATSFHPELTKNISFHKYFIDMIKDSKR